MRRVWVGTVWMSALDKSAGPTRRTGRIAPPLSYGAWRELGARPNREGSIVTRYIAVPPRGILNNPSVTGMGYWSINPYIGCEFGCSYCYARDTHRWTVERGANRHDAPVAAREAATLSSADAFEHRILVKEGARAVLSRTLDQQKVGDDAIVIGTATDPYQPAERRFGLTRTLLETFRGWVGLRIHVITKSPLVARDAPLLAELSRRHALSVSISLGSMDAELLRRLEARTPIPTVRLRTMRTLADAGVSVGLLAAPILPGLTDGRLELRALLSAAKVHGAEWAACQPLRMGSATRSTLISWLQRHRPDLAARYALHYGTGSMVTSGYAKRLQQRFAELRTAAGIPADRERQTRPGSQVEMFG